MGEGFWLDPFNPPGIRSVPSTDPTSAQTAQALAGGFPPWMLAVFLAGGIILCLLCTLICYRCILVPCTSKKRSVKPSKLATGPLALTQGGSSAAAAAATLTSFAPTWRKKTHISGTGMSGITVSLSKTLTVQRSRKF